MGRRREQPRYNVISLRVNDEDWQALREMVQANKKNVSDIMRSALRLYFYSNRK